MQRPRQRGRGGGSATPGTRFQADPLALVPAYCAGEREGAGAEGSQWHGIRLKNTRYLFTKLQMIREEIRCILILSVDDIPNI